MKSQKRKWQGWLLLLAMVLCLGWGRLAHAVQEYQIWVQGTQVTSDNASDVLGDGTVKYNVTSETLILNNATIKAQPLRSGDNVNRYGIYSSWSLNVILVGDNNIVPSSVASANAYGIEVMNKDLSIKGKGSLTVIAGEAVTGDSYGIVAGSVTVENTKVYAKGGRAMRFSCGIGSDLTIKGGTVWMQGGEADNSGRSCGMRETLRVQKGRVTATGKTWALPIIPQPTYYPPTYQILVGRKEDGSDVKVFEQGPSSEWRYVSIGPVTYGVTVTTKDDGMGTATAKPLRAEPEDTVELNATPNTGYVFDHWKVTPDTVALADANKPSTSLKMPAEDVVVQAVFQAKPQPPEPSTPTDPPDPHEPASPEPAEPSTDQEAKPDGGSTFWFGWMPGGDASSKQDRATTSRSATVTEVRFQLGKADLTYTQGDQTGVYQMDVAPFMYQDRLMVPIRFVAQALGFTVDWNHETRTAILTNGDTVVEMPVGTNIIRVNGQYHESDVPSMIHSDRTMLSLGNVARALGLRDGVDLLWDQEAKVVTIKHNVAP